MNFKNLQSLFKQIEIELRSEHKLSKYTWELLAELPDWDFKITQSFITEVNLAIQQGNLNFVYKKYNIEEPTKNKPKKDLLIVALKRGQHDLVLTDVINRLVTPHNITWEYLELWGMEVAQARNFSVQKALEKGCKYLFTLDDDIIMENTALLKIWETMQETDRIVVGGEYQKKADYPVTAHGNFFDTDKEYLKETDLIAPGCALINLDKLTKQVPPPYFWVFLAPDGLWAMGEDAFFTKNLIEYTKEYPIIDFRPSIIHYDKIWKRFFGERDSSVTYASNIINDYATFDFMRQCPIHPLINIAVPKRKEEDLVATDFNRVLSLRGYKIEHSGIFGYNIDEARNQLATNSVKLGSTYTLFIDNDIILPENALVQMLEVMEEDEKKEIGMVVGDYLLKGKVPHSINLQLDSSGKVTELNRIKKLKNKNIIDSNWLVGLGCALIRTEVFRQVQYPYFLCYSTKLKKTGVDVNQDGGENEDASFCENLFINGYKIKIINDLKCVHIDYNTGYAYGYDKEFDINKYACYEWINRFKYIDVDNY